MDKLVIRATARTFKFAPEADYIMSQYYLWNMRRWSGAEIFFSRFRIFLKIAVKREKCLHRTGISEPIRKKMCALKSRRKWRHLSCPWVSASIRSLLSKTMMVPVSWARPATWSITLIFALVGVSVLLGAVVAGYIMVRWGYCRRWSRQIQNRYVVRPVVLEANTD